MVYEEYGIPAIQYDWEKSFVKRFRQYATTSERDATLDALLKDGTMEGTPKSVVLKIRVYSDDTEQLKLNVAEG